MSVLPISQPPVVYESQGAIACRGILINAEQNVWLLAAGGAPVSGTDGAGWAGPGSIVIDAVGKATYENTGTTASPVWSKYAVGTGPDGIATRPLALTAFRNIDGSAVAASPGAGVFGYAITLGTSAALIGETSNNNTKTDDAIVEYVLPTDYVAGAALAVTVNVATVTAGAPTYATKTFQVKAFRMASDGTMGADISTGGAQAITPAGADLAWVVTGATLNPGDRLIFEVEGILHDTAAVACHIAVNSFRVG